VQTLKIQKVCPILILVGRWVLGREEIDAVRNSVGRSKFASNTVEAIWSVFWKEHDFYANRLQWLKLWGMLSRRLKFKTCKVLEVYWIFVGFNKSFMRSIILGSPCTSNQNPGSKMSSLTLHRNRFWVTVKPKMWFVSLFWLLWDREGQLKKEGRKIVATENFSFPARTAPAAYVR